MSENIKKAIEASGMQKTYVARQLGVSKQLVNQWCMPDRIPRWERVVQIADVLGISPQKLLYGKDDPHSISTGDAVHIPCLEVEASCGFGEYLREMVQMVRMIKVSREWLRRHCPTANTQKLNIITADGDSMLPLINSGDLVFVDTSVTDVRAEAVYVFTYDDGLYIKRLQRIPEGLRAISDNSIYPPFEITKERLDLFRLIGRVVVSGNLKTL